jgi:hypothetical protein
MAELHECDVAELRSTRITVGIIEVHDKRKRLEAMGQRERREFLQARPIPAGSDRTASSRSPIIIVWPARCPMAATTSAIRPDAQRLRRGRGAGAGADTHGAGEGPAGLPRRAFALTFAPSATAAHAGRVFWRLRPPRRRGFLRASGLASGPAEACGRRACRCGRAPLGFCVGRAVPSTRNGREGSKPATGAIAMSCLSRRRMSRSSRASSCETSEIGQAFGAGAAGAADAVDVVLGVDRQVEVDHVRTGRCRCRARRCRWRPARDLPLLKARARACARPGSCCRGSRRRRPSLSRILRACRRRAWCGRRRALRRLSSLQQLRSRSRFLRRRPDARAA